MSKRTKPVDVKTDVKTAADPEALESSRAVFRLGAERGTCFPNPGWAWSGSEWTAVGARVYPIKLVGQPTRWKWATDSGGGVEDYAWDAMLAVRHQLGSSTVQPSPE